MSELREFFEKYLEAWNHPDKLSTFYNEPFIAARMGTTRLNASRAETTRFFQEVLEKYRAKGFARAQFIKMESQRLGDNSVLATVQWAYKDKEGKTLWEWTFSYNLYKSGGGPWKIVLQTLHD